MDAWGSYQSWGDILFTKITSGYEKTKRYYQNKTKQNKPQKKQIKYKTKQTPYIEAVSFVDWWCHSTYVHLLHTVYAS